MDEIKNNQTNQRGGKRPGAGRKRGRPDRASAADKESLEALARLHTAVAIDALVDIATNGESESARVTASLGILDRGYGKPRQSIETEDITRLTDEQRRERLLKIVG